MAYFSFNNIRVAGVACAVPTNEVKTESYKPQFGDEEVEKFMEMTGSYGNSDRSGRRNYFNCGG